MRGLWGSGRAVKMVIVRIKWTSVYEKHLELCLAQIASQVLTIITIAPVNIVIAMQFVYVVLFVLSILLFTHEYHFYIQ